MVTPPALLSPFLVCLRAGLIPSRINELFSVSNLLGTSTVAFFLLFLCACARASPAIVFFFSVAVCFVWYPSVDTAAVVCTLDTRGGVTVLETVEDVKRDGVSALSGEQDALLSWSAAAGANRNLMRRECKSEHWRRRSAT